MRQAKIGNDLYIYDLEPYIIVRDIDNVDNVFVQEEKYDDFKALNPSLPLKKKNYLLMSVEQPVWYEKMVAPEPDTVTIVVDSAAVEQNITWDAEGYALTAKEFSTTPASYASAVVITVDGGTYTEGMLLQAGTHTVLYSLAATDNNFAASATYSVVITQDATPDTVTITIDTSTVEAEIDWDAEGYALTAKSFTTDPAKYESDVVITVDGNAYSQGMLIQAGSHTVLYSLAASATNFAASASYSVVISQDAEPDTVIITVDTSTVEQNITWDSTGYALTAKEFSTDPTKYASSVVITVDGNAYSQGMLLQAGSHTVLYSLAATDDNFAASASYSVVITQDATPTTVTINLDTTQAEYNIAYNSAGHAFTAREFSTTPSSYASSVVVSVDGGQYTQGMLLQSGVHTTLYSLAATSYNFAASSYYNVVVTQDAEPDTVTINVDNSQFRYNIAYNSIGYAFTAREFTTEPAKYASDVEITVDNNQYSSGMLLQAGTHRVQYDLAPTSENHEATAYYNAVITQDAEPDTVIITVDNTTVNQNITWDAEGYAFTAKEFSTSPAKYAQDVVITVDGNAYSSGMLLQAGTHTVLYSLAAGVGNHAASAQYSVVVTQDATPDTVTITVDTTAISQNLAWDSSGYAFTAREFTTSPASYASAVVITVDGNTYSQGMLLQAGTHVVQYTLTATAANFGANASYNVVITQDSEPETVTINVDTTTVNESIAWNANSYTFTAKSFTTSPIGYENDVVITVDGGAYSSGMSLNVGTHVVLYSLAASSSNYAASAQYSIVIAQEAEPILYASGSNSNMVFDSNTNRYYCMQNRPTEAKADITWKLVDHLNNDVTSYWMNSFIWENVSGFNPNGKTICKYSYNDTITNVYIKERSNSVASSYYSKFMMNFNGSSYIQATTTDGGSGVTYYNLPLTVNVNQAYIGTTNVSVEAAVGTDIKSYVVSAIVEKIHPEYPLTSYTTLFMNNGTSYISQQNGQMLVTGYGTHKFTCDEKWVIRSTTTRTNLYASDNNSDYYLTVNIIEPAPAITSVSIVVNESSVTENVSVGNSYEFVPKSFTTSPTGYENEVVITVSDGNTTETYDSQNGLWLSSGTYTVLYTLTAGNGHSGDTAQYTLNIVEVSEVTWDDGVDEDNSSANPYQITIEDGYDMKDSLPFFTVSTSTNLNNDGQVVMAITDCQQQSTICYVNYYYAGSGTFAIDSIVDPLDDNVTYNDIPANADDLYMLSVCFTDENLVETYSNNLYVTFTSGGGEEEGLNWDDDLGDYDNDQNPYTLTISGNSVTASDLPTFTVGLGDNDPADCILTLDVVDITNEGVLLCTVNYDWDDQNQMYTITDVTDENGDVIADDAIPVQEGDMYMLSAHLLNENTSNEYYSSDVYITFAFE